MSSLLQPGQRVEEGGRGGDQKQGVESESDPERAGIKSGASWNPTFVQSTSTSGTNHVLA